MTPIIAGTICGICVGTAWLVALIVVIVKRTKRKKRKRAGEDVDDDVPINASSTDPEGRPSRDIFIVPPDPAVLQGQHQPGERLVVERKKRWWRLTRSGFRVAVKERFGSRSIEKSGTLCNRSP